MSQARSLTRMKYWLMEMRAPFFTATVVPVFLGTAIAWAVGGVFHLGYFLLTLVAALCLHAGTNIANDYYDHLSTDDEINEEYVSPFTGGSRMIQKGLMRPNEVLTEAIILFAAGSLIGLYLVWVRGPFILLLGLIGVFSGFFYTAPPFRLVNRGIGELVLGINFGVLEVLGAFYVQTRTLSWEAVVAGLPVSFLIAAVVYINEFQDYAADKAVGKHHLVVRLGKEKAVHGYLAIMGLPYLCIVLGVVLKMISPFTLLALITLPLMVRSYRNVRVSFHDSRKLAPSNAATIMIHLSVGLLLSLGYVLEKMIS